MDHGRVRGQRDLAVKRKRPDEEIWQEGYEEGIRDFRRTVLEVLAGLDMRATLGIVRGEMTIDEMKEMIRDA